MPWIRGYHGTQIETGASLVVVSTMMLSVQGSFGPVVNAAAHFGST